MSGSQLWMIWPGNAALSLLTLVILGMLFFYAARKPMHELIRAAGLAVAGPLRITARWLLGAANEMSRRNREVLLSHGRQEVGQRIEREFERVAVLVNRDLQGYPALQRRLLDEIVRIEVDYMKCGEVPPPPPVWVEAVAAVAGIKSAGNEMVQNILDEIRRSVDRIHDKAIGEYRRSYESRHRILGGFMPFWRSVDRTLSEVDRKLTGLQNSAAAVDAQMARYQQISSGSDQAAHALAVSSFTQFAIAGIVMAIAAGGAFINFKLIALPMSEMVGAGDYLTSSLRTSEVAALVIILVEASMGLFVMETLRITHLFPPIANLNDRTRRRMLWTALSLLVILAGVEAALAMMRDMLIADKQALLQSLAAVQPAAADGWVGKIPTAGQMLLGFILPFALAFIAIPLESLIHSARTVGGLLLLAPVRLAAVLLFTLGSLAKHASRVLVHLYDVAIVLPLLGERVVRAWRSAPEHLDEDEVAAGRRAL
jgi:hypothetical protein